MQVVDYEVITQNYDNDLEVWVNIGYKKETKVYKYNYSENEFKRKARRKARKYRKQLRYMGIYPDRITITVNGQIVIQY